jgi:hypothetical protein
MHVESVERAKSECLIHGISVPGFRSRELLHRQWQESKIRIRAAYVALRGRLNPATMPGGDPVLSLVKRRFSCRLPILGLVLPILILSSGVGLTAQEGAPGRLVGRVVDHEKGNPVEGAELRIRGTGLMRVSDPAGRFEFEGVPGGTWVLEVSHLSYRVRTDSIQVLPGETLEVAVSLSPDPLLLDPLVVTVRSRVLEASGFYVRRDQGLSGVLLTREQIEERNPARFTDLFISIPGARIAHRDGVGGSVVVFGRGNLMQGETCFPDVWVDGIITTIVDLDQFHPDQVEGLEVYQGAGTPLRYNSACGAILIWTHVPVKGRGGIP